MRKIIVIGHLAEGKVYLDGQTVKTNNLVLELRNFIGKNNVGVVDTYNWKKRPARLVVECLNALKEADGIIILPAYNGIKIFLPMFAILNKFFNKKILYSVIGGWLPEYLDDNKWLIKYAKQIDKIYVETMVMKKGLEKNGINNVKYIPNFKRLNKVDINNIPSNFNKPYSLCTFSRVNKQKGIEDLCKVLNNINSQSIEPIYKLDVFGQIEQGYEEEFKKVQDEYKSFMSYRGCIDSSKSVEVLYQYYALVFPTKYISEGIPGTILDAYASGLPVVASRWKSSEEVIRDKITGLIYEFNDLEDLQQKLMALSKCEDMSELRINCLNEIENYNPRNIIENILSDIF